MRYTFSALAEPTRMRIVELLRTGSRYVGEIEDFAAAIRDRRPAEVDGREGAANVDLLLRAVDG